MYPVQTFMSDYAAWRRAEGSEPTLDFQLKSVTVTAFDIFRGVMHRGGFARVNRNNAWHQVGESCGLQMLKRSRLAATLKDIYVSHLKSFEEAVRLDIRLDMMDPEVRPTMETAMITPSSSSMPPLVHDLCYGVLDYSTDPSTAVPNPHPYYHALRRGVSPWDLPLVPPGNHAFENVEDYLRRPWANPSISVQGAVDCCLEGAPLQELDPETSEHLPQQLTRPPELKFGGAESGHPDADDSIGKPGLSGHIYAAAVMLESYDPESVLASLTSLNFYVSRLRFEDFPSLCGRLIHCVNHHLMHRILPSSDILERVVMSALSIICALLTSNADIFLQSFDVAEPERTEALVSIADDMPPENMAMDTLEKSSMLVARVAAYLADSEAHQFCTRLSLFTLAKCLQEFTLENPSTSKEARAFLARISDLLEEAVGAEVLLDLAERVRSAAVGADCAVRALEASLLFEGVSGKAQAVLAESLLVCSLHPEQLEFVIGTALFRIDLVGPDMAGRLWKVLRELKASEVDIAHIIVTSLSLLAAKTGLDIAPDEIDEVIHRWPDVRGVLLAIKC
ncbi:MAG: hypothetical protein KVP17_000455 [Porospora cf. gigantea B]|uniref:uncharacterized protein n=1 Tax=Porospora cf. gigantea B TaxID=2853592 RepID=UPI003571E5FC|nr:MAG: hypothetical protein KVP17_000455 [Porospora cf. gigantea B]